MMKTSSNTSDAIHEESGTLSDYSAQQYRIEIAAIILFAALALWSLWRLAIATDQPSEYLMVVGAAFAGWVAVDLFSGLVHWGFDTWGSIHTPVLGQRFIRPFREHHWDAEAITRHGFIETNGAGCIASVPVLVCTTTMPITSDGWFFLQAFGVFCALAVLFTNQCHKWAHMEPDQLASSVRLAQRLRLILRPEDHRKHHVRPFNSHYCTATGWLNGPLQAIRFFRWMERCVALCTRTDTRQNDR
jgi:ubiquitin-conjugating enzyme E2 variant